MTILDLQASEVKPDPHQGIGETKSTLITVNGARKYVVGNEVNYAQLVALAHPSLAPEQGRAFTITYLDGRASSPTGFLFPGDRVEVAVEQAFYVLATDQS